MTDELEPQGPVVETRTPAYYQYLREKKGYSDKQIEQERARLGSYDVLGLTDTFESDIRHQIGGLMGQLIAPGYDWPLQLYGQVKIEVFELRKRSDWFVEEGRIPKETILGLLDELEEADWNKDTVAGLYKKAQEILSPSI